MKRIKLEERKRTFRDEAIKAIEAGVSIVGVEAEQCELDDGTVEPGQYLLHGLNENGDSVIAVKEEHLRKTAEQIEEEYAAEIASYLQFRAAVRESFIGLG